MGSLPINITDIGIYTYKYVILKPLSIFCRCTLARRYSLFLVDGISSHMKDNISLL